MRAVNTLLDVPAERGGAAGLDGRHDAQLDPAEVAGMSIAPGCTVVAEDVRHLQRRAGHARFSGRGGRLHVQEFERALDTPYSVQGHPRITGGGRNVPMPEQVLDDPDVDPLLQEMGGGAVPKGMNGDALVQASDLGGTPTRPLQRARRDRPGRIRTRKEPVLRTRALPVGAQDRKHLFGEHHIAVSAPFATPDMDHHPGAIDALDGERHHLGDAQTRSVGRGQGGSGLKAGHCLEEADDLLRRKNGRQGVGPACQRDLLGAAAPAQRRAVEEPQGAQDRIDGRRLETA